MMKNEYLNVNEISRLTEQSTRNVRRIIKKIANDVAIELLYKDNNMSWKIHRLLLSRFKPQRIRRDKYFALSIDPCYNYTENEIDVVLKYIFELTNEKGLEINYVIEQKVANNRNHLHCYVKCSNKKKLMQNIRIGFSRVSYHQSQIFDITGWKNYITKDNKEIKILKNE